MNLFKIALPFLFAAQSISAEDNSASAIRELIAEVKDLKADQANLKAEIATLKSGSKHSSLKGKKNVRRAQEVPEIPSDIDISALTEADMEEIISGVAAENEQLSGLLYGIIHTVNKLVGLSKCVSYEKYFYEDEDACIIGSEYVDNTYISAGHEDVIIHAPEKLKLKGSKIIMFGFKIKEFAIFKASFTFFSKYWSLIGTKINGVWFPFNPSVAPFGSIAELDEEDVNEIDSDSSEAEAEFDAMLVEKGYKAVFNTTSP